MIFLLIFNNNKDNNNTLNQSFEINNHDDFKSYLIN